MEIIKSVIAVSQHRININTVADVNNYAVKTGLKHIFKRVQANFVK